MLFGLEEEELLEEKAIKILEGLTSAQQGCTIADTQRPYPSTGRGRY